MIIKNKLFSDLAYGLGILKCPSIPYAKTNVDEALGTIKKHGKVCPYVCGSSKPGFGQRGISGRTKSWSQHCGFMIPKKAADRVRKNHPDLMKPRILPGSIPRPDGYDWSLPAVPECRHDMEVIESQATVAINSADAATREDEQVVVFLRDWTPAQEDAILYAAYYLYGAPYDVLEFGKNEFFFLPNPKELKVCSSYVAHGLRGRNPTALGAELGDNMINEWMDRNGVDIEACVPSHVRTYLFSNKLYHDAIPFHCTIWDAMRGM